jgi:putative peptidoglycan lipid II flippase
MLNVVVPAYAAQKDTLTPLLVSIFTTAVNIGLAIVLSRPLGQGGLAHGGLPLARALSIGLEVTIDLAILRIRWGGVNASRIVMDAGKALIATGAMAAGVLAIRALLHPGAFMMLVLGGGLGAALYFGVALAIGIREVRSIPEALIRSLLRRPIAESVPS